MSSQKSNTGANSEMVVDTSLARGSSRVRKGKGLDSPPPATLIANLRPDRGDSSKESLTAVKGRFGSATADPNVTAAVPPHRPTPPPSASISGAGIVKSEPPSLGSTASTVDAEARAAEAANTRRVDAIAEMLALGYEGRELDVAFRNWEEKEREKREEEAREREREREREEEERGRERGRSKKRKVEEVEIRIEAREERDVNIPVGMVRRDSSDAKDDSKEASASPSGDDWEHKRGRTLHSGSGTEGNAENVDQLPGSSRSTSSNETERERNRGGGDWNLLDYGHSNIQQAFPASPTSPIPLTRMYLKSPKRPKRSWSVPAAPRPTRPRLQLDMGDREESNAPPPANESMYGYDGDQSTHSPHADNPYNSSPEHPPLSAVSFSTGAQFNPSASLSPTRQSSARPYTYPVPGGGGLTPQAYSTVEDTYYTSSSGLTSGTWAPPQLQRHRSSGSGSSPSVSASSSASSPPSTASPSESSMASMMFGIASTYSPISLSNTSVAEYSSYDSNGRNITVEGRRSGSGSPTSSTDRARLFTFPTPSSAPIPFRNVFSHGGRPRAWTTRSPNVRDQSTSLPRYQGPPSSAMPAYLDMQQRPRSRASPPPSSPASPIADTQVLPIRGRGLFPRPTHRKMPTWSEHWSSVNASSSADSSPVPSVPSSSASPQRHSDPNLAGAEIGMTWQEVENERREFLSADVGMTYDDGIRISTENDGDSKREVDVMQLMSTKEMGWQQRTDPSPDTEMQLSPFADDATHLWLTGDESVAAPGHTGFVTSILDPHLAPPELYEDSSKMDQEETDRMVDGASSHAEVPAPTPFPSSSYSTLSGWAGGGEESEGQLMPNYQSRSFVGEPVITVPVPPSFSSSMSSFSGFSSKDIRQEGDRQGAVPNSPFTRYSSISDFRSGRSYGR
ncbi:hypothetical protein GYMLUDRAFT_50932 [Collybiopsis luxurians FD-317 M1]|uniref:Uncharacterized protein n=1 Tax=Collybiopsis luxurians FD-317 M1 TaxID=944289 RepID=A0A0D0B9J9_9AGAR|nr:hypothetical protein GYMLUDRAFT_50932 [Collybiopsis luxurians FD-317 M1]